MSIRVKADLSAYGAGAPETIAVLDIGNRDALGRVCDYDYRFWDPQDGAKPAGPWFVLRDHDRAGGVWSLVAAILARRAAGDEEPSGYTGD